jgi:glucokinase
MKNMACFDIGGTFIKFGVVNEKGEIFFKGKFSTPKSNNNVEIPKLLIQKIIEMKEEFILSAVGISTAGQVDSRSGVIIYCSENIRNYTGTKLGEKIKEATRLNCFVENDVNAAALGEYWKGSAVGNDTFVCVALGTGIGGAIIINGKLYKGVNGGAGELGHTIINEGGEKCACGMSGCYERYASTSAFVRKYKSIILEKNFDTENIDGEEIMNRVHKKEKLAVEAYDEFIDHIVTGLINITHILDPGLIVIGGGISAQGTEFFDEINRRFKVLAMPSYAKHTKIIKASLENDAGILGACYICL